MLTIVKALVVIGVVFLAWASFAFFRELRKIDEATWHTFGAPSVFPKSPELGIRFIIYLFTATHQGERFERLNSLAVWCKIAYIAWAAAIVAGTAVLLLLDG